MSLISFQDWLNQSRVEDIQNELSNFSRINPDVANYLQLQTAAMQIPGLLGDFPMANQLSGIPTGNPIDPSAYTGMLDTQAIQNQVQQNLAGLQGRNPGMDSPPGDQDRPTQDLGGEDSPLQIIYDSIVGRFSEPPNLSPETIGRINDYLEGSSSEELRAIGQEIINAGGFDQWLEQQDIVLGDPGPIEDTTRSPVETVFDDEGNITTIIDPTLVTLPPLVGTIDVENPEGGSGGGETTGDTSDEESGARQDSVSSTPVEGDRSLEGDLTRNPTDTEGTNDEDIVGRQIAEVVFDDDLTEEQRGQLIGEWERYSGREWNPDWTNADDIYGPLPPQRELTDEDIDEILNAPPQAGAPFIVVNADGTVIDANTGEPVDITIPGQDPDQYGGIMPGVYDDAGNRIGNVPAGTGGQQQRDLPTSTGSGDTSLPPIDVSGSGTSTGGQNQGGGDTTTRGGGGNQTRNPGEVTTQPGNTTTGGSDSGNETGQTGTQGAGRDPGTGVDGTGGGPGSDEGDDGDEKEKSLFDDFKFRPTMANVSFQDPGMPGVIGGTPQRQSILGMFREYL